LTKRENGQAQEPQGFERENQPQNVPQGAHYSGSASEEVCPLRLLPENDAHSA
jgi:hypothetical protein